DELSSQLFEIVVPSNHPKGNGSRASLKVRFRASLGQAHTLTYAVRSGSGTIDTNVRHREVLKFEVMTGKPLSGDSGSAVVATLPDGDRTLVGMFIASPDDGRFAFAIPAWELADADNWKALPSGTQAVEPT